MRSVNNSVETVNAAASAIVSAESRVQPSSVQKKKWGSWWRLYWCFGSKKKNNKRIGHAVLVPEPATSGAPVAPVQNSSSNSTSIFFPFIAPPSSPASFLPSGPPSVSHTPDPCRLLSLTVNERPSVFTIGPYANETQPVTPPVFSAFTTEPSTAPFTPPPESPSSPEVPFAQLLTSSLERARRNSGGMNQKFSAAHYEFKSHQVYPGSPGGNLISPGSGTSSPYPGKCSIIEFRIGEPPKFLGFEHFTARKWGSRFGSGSITPAGQGSRLGSGALTPDGGGGGLSSKLASGALTPLEGSLLDSQICEIASLGDSEHGSKVAQTQHRFNSQKTRRVNSTSPCRVGPSHSMNQLDFTMSSWALVGAYPTGSSRHDEGVTVAHRVSFELTGEDVARCLASKLNRSGSHERASGDQLRGPNCYKTSGETESEQSQKLRSFSLGSSKEFKFDNTNEEMIEKVRSEWWANEKVAGNSWSFFPVLRSGFT